MLLYGNKPIQFESRISTLVNRGNEESWCQQTLIFQLEIGGRVILQLSFVHVGDWEEASHWSQTRETLAGRKRVFICWGHHCLFLEAKESKGFRMPRERKIVKEGILNENSSMHHFRFRQLGCLIRSTITDLPWPSTPTWADWLGNGGQIIMLNRDHSP